MEKTTPNPVQPEVGDDFVAKAKANRKPIMLSLLAIAVVVVGILAWYLIVQAGNRSAAEAVAKADAAAIAGTTPDSALVVLYQDAAKAGYKSGNRAKAEAAILLYRQGKYEEALKELDDCSLDDKIAAAGVYALKGDCYVNLDQLDKALGAYDKAISKADGNPEIVPLMLIKEANIYRAQQNYDKEAKCYKTILDEYPKYVSSTRTDIRKYYERALASAAQL